MHPDFSIRRGADLDSPASISPSHSTTVPRRCPWMPIAEAL